jgi:hypothetical protein
MENLRARGRGPGAADHHIAGGKHDAADVVAKTQAIVSEPALLRAMFDVGYFPPNTPPTVALDYDI